MIGGEDVRVVWWYGCRFAVHFRLAVARPVDGVGRGDDRHRRDRPARGTATSPWPPT